ncbi:rRNA methyltransferase 2, mitochondrial isoform X2 [Acinonyx jubatus]|uniref:rRNA methyltransferase 2, mitochondrial isoform X2 n=1 Tax=Acinonyx jubatus TaxID=32536 RepID=A0ABM3PBF6_ACIJB|nr:rRNA methyltransferase 2, mitochondrial isoform X2 [Acinonyx jubatus]
MYSFLSINCSSKRLSLTQGQTSGRPQSGSNGLLKFSCPLGPGASGLGPQLEGPQRAPPNVSGWEAATGPGRWSPSQVVGTPRSLTRVLKDRIHRTPGSGPGSGSLSSDLCSPGPPTPWSRTPLPPPWLLPHPVPGPHPPPLAGPGLRSPAPSPLPCSPDPGSAPGLPGPCPQTRDRARFLNKGAAEAGGAWPRAGSEAGTSGAGDGSGSAPMARSLKLVRASLQRQRFHTAGSHYKGRTAAEHLWLTRHLRDPFVKAARVESYRCRSAFKLLEIPVLLWALCLG